MAYFKNFANSYEFYKAVKPLWGRQVEELGLYPSCPLGSFTPDRLEEIADFCQKNKQYHIVSYYMGNMLFNDIYPWASSFKIASGDKDPQLVSYHRETCVKFLELLTFKLLRYEQLAESGELERINKLMVGF